MNKYNDKYRITSARLKYWDYANEGIYFITICTKNKEHFFGEINDGIMKLSKIGQIVEYEWLKTFEMRPDMNLTMGEYVIMPDHFHAIIIIGKNEYNRGRDAMHCVSTGGQKFGPQSKNLASIVRGFKIGVTKNARQIDSLWNWQPRYHDHIIRDEQSFQRISYYIINNPLN